MVLRRQTFAGHTLAVVGFPGAAGATLVGVSAALGYFGFCVAAALVIAAAAAPAGSGGYSEESAVIGTVQAFALACGFLFVASTRASSTASTRCCSAASSASPTARCWSCWSSPSSRSPRSP